MSEKLLTRTVDGCPFCGNVPTIHHGAGATIRCWSRDHDGAEVSSWAPTADEAIEKWNRRPAHPLSQPRVEWPEDKPCAHCGAMTNSLAGDPGLWPVDLHYNGNGKNMRWHHRCVSEQLRLAHLATIPSAKGRENG